MRLSRRRFLICAIGTAAAVLAPACAPQSSEPQPPEIAYGQDACEACGMLISEKRFACATVMADKKALKFDDIGDMLVYHMDHPDLQVAAYFVHDYNTEAWIHGETAFYVMSAAIATPMGHGIAAFEKPAEAEALAQDKQTTVLTFDDLRVQVHVKVHGG